MNPSRSALRTSFEVLRAEGWRAAVDRARDRWRESQWRVTFPPAAADDVLTAPVLNISGLPAAARFGGAAQALMARLRIEARERSVALLSPLGSRTRLDWWTSEARFGFDFPRDGSGDPLLPDPGWLTAVRSCLDRVSPRFIHVEGVTGLSLPSVLELSESGVPLVLSVHDFALFCRRPNLWTSDDRFCDFCTDAEQCRSCLTGAGDERTLDQVAHRELASAILERAVAVVCPSEYVRVQLRNAFPSNDPGRWVVIAPGIEDPALDGLSPRDPRQTAIIGSVQAHKGGALAIEVASEVASRGIDLTVYGGNGHEFLWRLRDQPGVTIRGYYASGALPDLLVRQRASVALILSQVPETFSLVLSEAWAAGVPVVSTPMGALTERLGSGGGRLVAPDADAVAIADAVDELRDRPNAVPRPVLASDSAAAHVALYLACAGVP